MYGLITLKRIQTNANRLAQACAKVELWYQQETEAFDSTHTQNLTQIDSKYQSSQEQITLDYNKSIEELRQQLPAFILDQEQIASKRPDLINGLLRQLQEFILTQEQTTLECTNMDKKLQQQRQNFITNAAFMALPWEDEEWWETWSPSATYAPASVRWGCLIKTVQSNKLILPAMVPFIGHNRILIKANGKAKNQAIAAIQSALLRLTAVTPPGKLRFTFFDPVGRGQNVAAFMHLGDYDEALITSRVWTEPGHIEEQLSKLTEQMETVIQKYLRNQYETIEAYNEQAGEVAEPYRVLVALDFPTNFNEASARRLVSIAQNGGRCGIYTIILVDTTKPMPYGFDLSDLEQSAIILNWNGTGFEWKDNVFAQCDLVLDTPPEPKLFNHILNTVGQAALESSKVEVPFARVIPATSEWWQATTETGINVGLGPAGARKLQYLNLGRGTSQHTLVAGKTGSGKSTLLHVMILNLALTYSPDELQLYLIDFKKGVEFKLYSGANELPPLPHARVIAIESEREFGLSVLKGLDDELKERGELFRSVGVDSISDYRRQTGKKMPRVLLIVDEFQEFFIEDDIIAGHCSQILDRLVRQGRAFGIHILLGSQTLAGGYSLSRSTIDQMAVRIALQCSESDSRVILSDENGAARLLARPGEAIYNDANGLIEGNNLFQVAWLSEADRHKYVRAVHAQIEKQNYKVPYDPIVFEGNAPALIAHNKQICDLLETSSQKMPRRVSAWLGDPIAIKESTACSFRRQSGSHLLVVGQNDELAMGMFVATVISIAAQCAPDTARFYFLDFGSVDAPYAAELADLAEQLPHFAQWGRRRALSRILNTVKEELNRRLELDEREAIKQEAIYLFIFGIQRARDLRPSEGYGYGISEEDEKPDLSRQYREILREGPDVGIHSVLWCDTYNNVERVIERSGLREFESRVVMQMSDSDSSNLIDTSAANKLGLYRAFLYSEDEGRLEKFRPYSIPNALWLSQVLDRLKHKN